MIKKNFFIYSSFILLIFLLDRISKIYVIYLDKKLPGSEIFSSRYLNIQLIWNEGIAFGLFSFDDKFFYNLLTGLIIIISAAIIYFIVNTVDASWLSLMQVIMHDLRYFFVSGLTLPFEKAPAPSEITR